MWPFTPKTLYDRYSKLMRLIMSIDSHFEVTENKEDSVRLHLPNYKGNQPMDFHIYMMEPFLFISFVTEIEGEKISTVNSYPQDMNQQDMFNAAMASNLDKVHQVMEDKLEKDNHKDDAIAESKGTDSRPTQTEAKTIGIKRSWSLSDFAKEHGKMQVGEFANKETGEVFKSCIFTKPDGTRTFVAFAAKMGKLTPKQIAAMKDELQVVQLESGNYSLCKIANNSWEEVNRGTIKPYSFGIIVNTSEFTKGQELQVKSTNGKFGIVDVRIDESNWRVKKSYHNIIEGKEYNISDIRTIEYDKEKDIVKIVFNKILIDGYDAIWFSRQCNRVQITFYKGNEYVKSFNSEYDKAHSTLGDLFAAFCALASLEGYSAIVTLSGKAFQVNLIQNYYNGSMIHDYDQLTAEGTLADGVFLEKYGQTKEDYFHKYFNKVSTLTAICRSKDSWARGEYPELEIGKSYEVSHIGVLRSCSNIILREFEHKEYNAGCFDLYENGEPMEWRYSQDPRFWAPYLRDLYRQRNAGILPDRMEKYGIRGHLKNVEHEYDVKVLLAVESGSRAWGFESKNSDWDVRFIYVHKPEWYFKVDEQRDVIEHTFEDDVDLVGWELRKALGLFKRSNPSMFEWLHSPKVYYMDEEFGKRIHEVERDCFNPIRMMYHYNHIYNKHNERYLQQEGFPMKRFLYYLRGVLACKWIDNNNSLPPVPFKELVEATVDDAGIRSKIDDLLEIKKGGKESDMQVVDKALLDYARQWEVYYNERVGTFRPEQNEAPTGKLDAILRDMVNKWKEK